MQTQKLIRPLRLGNKSFTVNLIQAPLAGFSCAPFRLLTRRYGNLAFSCTEMISCKSLLQRPPSAYKRYFAKDPREGAICYQLFGNNPQELATATKIVTDHGADLIDLNCGCPVRKVRSQGAGSSLLSNQNNLYQMIRALKNNTHLPVSVKIRVEGASGEKFNSELAKIIADAEPDFLVVHGRHWTEHYDHPCNYEQIQFFVETMKIPVIGNGDVACINSLTKMFATGCAGAMIGRAGVGRPWLSKQLIAACNNEEFHSPAASEVGMIFLEHIRLLAGFLQSEKIAILHARKLAGQYARGIKNKAELCTAVNSCITMSDLETLCQQFFC